MALTDCIGEIVAALGRDPAVGLTASERKAVAREAAKVKALVEAAGGNPAAAEAALKNFIAKRAAIRAAKEVQAAQRALAREQFRAFLDGAGDFTTKAPGQVLMARVIGSLKQFAGSRDSLGVRITRGVDQRSIQFFNSLEREGLTSYAFGPDQENIWKAYGALTQDKDATPFGPQAAKVAAILKKNADMSWTDMRNAGIPVGKLEDWFGPQIHDMYALGRAGGNRFGSDASEKYWTGAIYKRINWSKSFDGKLLAADETLRKRRLTELWNQFVAGKHLEYGPHDPTRGREIIFNNVSDAYEYNKEFGSGRTLAENIHAAVTGGARNIEINKMFGSNPVSLFREEAEALAKRINEDESLPASTRAKSVDQIKVAIRKAEDKWFPSLTGALANPDHAAAAQYLSTLQGVTNTLATAGSLIATVGDIPLAQRLMAQNGGRALQGYFNQISKTLDPLTARSKQEKMRIAATAEIMLQDAAMPLTHASMDSTIPGAAHTMMKYVHKGAGLTWMDDRNSGNAAVAWGADHWFDRAKTFDQLLPGQQDAFERFGIGAKEWNVIRQQEPLDIENGVKVFTAGNIRRMDLEKFKPLAAADASDATLRRLKTEVADKYRNFIGEMATRFRSAHSAEMKAITQQGQNTGSAIGFALNLVNGLKSWTYNFMRNHLGEIVAMDRNPENIGWSKMMWNFARGTGGVEGSRVAMTKFAANSIMFGMIIAELGLIRNGQEPIIPDSPEKMGQLLTLGFVRQGLGVYSDVLMAQMQRPEQSIFETLGRSTSPLVGETADVLEAAIRVANAGVQNAANPDYTSDKFWSALRRSARETAGVGADFLPKFAYTKFATDFYLKDEMLDAINPGYKDRLLKRAQDQGTPYMLANP